MIATPLGIALGGLLALGIAAVASRSSRMTPEVFLIPAVFGTGVSAVVGTAQWLLLRQHVRCAANWIVATIAGRALGWSAAVGLLATIANSIDDTTAGIIVLTAAMIGAISGAIYGVCTGLCLVQFKQRPPQSNSQ